jgi:hypothetical protein
MVGDVLMMVLIVGGMMGSLVKRTQQIEKNKRHLFMGVSAVSAAVLATTGLVILPVAGLAAGAYLGWDWFQFRAKHGMRF